MRPPGQWKQEVVPSPVFELNTFTVLELTDTYALTYRCGRFDNELSYTVQVSVNLYISRTIQGAIIHHQVCKVPTILQLQF